MSLVVVTFTAAPPIEIHVVSLVIEPILALHADPDKKYPVGPGVGTLFTTSVPLLYGNVCPSVFCQIKFVPGLETNIYGI